jgi:hypothetical protein
MEGSTVLKQRGSLYEEAALLFFNPPIENATMKKNTAQIWAATTRQSTRSFHVFFPVISRVSLPREITGLKNNFG